MKTFAAFFLTSILALASAPPSPKLGSARCSWESSTAPNITNYTVWFGTNSKIYGNSQDVGTNLAATIPGLFRGIIYYFAATATDANGLTSDFSNEASCVIPMLPGSPIKLQSLVLNPL